MAASFKKAGRSRGRDCARQFCTAKGAATAAHRQKHLQSHVRSMAWVNRGAKSSTSCAAVQDSAHQGRIPRCSHACLGLGCRKRGPERLEDSGAFLSEPEICTRGSADASVTPSATEPLCFVLLRATKQPPPHLRSWAGLSEQAVHSEACDLLRQEARLPLTYYPCRERHTLAKEAYWSAVLPNAAHVREEEIPALLEACPVQQQLEIRLLSVCRDLGREAKRLRRLRLALQLVDQVRHPSHHRAGYILVGFCSHLPRGGSPRRFPTTCTTIRPQLSQRVLAQVPVELASIPASKACAGQESHRTFAVLLPERTWTDIVIVPPSYEACRKTRSISRSLNVLKPSSIEASMDSISAPRRRFRKECMSASAGTGRAFTNSLKKLPRNPEA